MTLERGPVGPWRPFGWNWLLVFSLCRIFNGEPGPLHLKMLSIFTRLSWDRIDVGLVARLQLGLQVEEREARLFLVGRLHPVDRVEKMFLLAAWRSLAAFMVAEALASSDAMSTLGVPGFVRQALEHVLAERRCNDLIPPAVKVSAASAPNCAIMFWMPASFA